MTRNFEEIVSSSMDRSNICSSDIPSLDLYIDQIITLLEEKLADNKRSDKDKILTKTMVNNYSKQGVIQSIKGKKYSKNHILEMLMVYSMKNTLSIDEIKRVLEPLYQEDKVDQLSTLYDQFIELKQTHKQDMGDMIQKVFENENFNFEQDEDRLVILLCLCALSEFYKVIAQQLIDEYYPAKKSK